MAEDKSNRNPGDMLRFIFTDDGFLVDDRGETLRPELQSWKECFQQDRYQALYRLGVAERPAGFDLAGGFLHLVAEHFFRLLTAQRDLELLREHIKVTLTEEDAARLEHSVPYALGTEHINAKWLRNVTECLNAVFTKEIVQYDGTVAMYLTEKSQHLRVPERVFFHLVESRDETYPFAFLATYATKGEDKKVRHVPLQYALTEYKNERDKLLTLLSCLNKAAEVSELIGSFVESGEMFHPLKLTAEEAYTILKEIPLIEQAGILCRIPNWWKRRASGVALSVTLGEEKETMLGFDTLVSMRPSLTVDGKPLTEEDIRSLLAQTEGLALLKGRWVEVDHERLNALLEEMENYRGEISLMDALKQGVSETPDIDGRHTADVGPLMVNGVWLSELLHHLRTPSAIRSAIVPGSFRATLRPYQKRGFTWLNYMYQLGFGACLADDMGLGKTVQVLAFLEKLRVTAGVGSNDGAAGRRTGNQGPRALLVVPTSLLGNWQKEAARFAPDMEVCILHGKGAAALGKEVMEKPAFLTVTTYGMVSRIEELADIVWDCIVLDEAQAIKNPMTRQTRQVKALKGRMRIALTGTPIENDLSNLWSLFDFLDKGLLGTSGEFHEFCKGLNDEPEGYARLKAMVSPFMLRRLKSDKSIITDLPEKWEKVDYVSLSKKQVVLYRKLIADLEKRLAEAEGMERRGMVLAAIVKLKQICNHPDQYLGQPAYSLADSGKFQMLQELCETICEKRERVIVFTQFKEITEPLAEFLTDIFHAKGYVLHGGTPVAARNRIVEAFQGEAYVPFVVLSVKAGGTGLNLTGANHVIHFDRWWNPAVENQATDRAYRIGQTKNVMVHKLVCEGTIEEKIDAMIRSKKDLAEQVIGAGGEKWITEMSNEELMGVLRLG